MERAARFSLRLNEETRTLGAVLWGSGDFWGDEELGMAFSGVSRELIGSESGRCL
jgi:hypothetical protein